MSFYDAQACGLPVLSENNNVNVERCSHNNGMNFNMGNVDDFRSKIEFMASIPLEQYNKMRYASRKFVENGYDYQDIALEYTEYLEKAIARYRK